MEVGWSTPNRQIGFAQDIAPPRLDAPMKDHLMCPHYDSMGVFSFCYFLKQN